jgi:surface antigen
MATSSAGCSFSYQLGSMFGKDDPDVTGSVAKTADPSGAPSDSDLASASKAATEVFAADRKDISIPWTNPATGAHGMVTPLASSYSQDGFLCRDFLASYVTVDSENWMQGAACRLHQGHWVVRSLKPLNRPDAQNRAKPA